jgi:hypothetical protein
MTPKILEFSAADMPVEIAELVQSSLIAGEIIKIGFEFPARGLSGTLSGNNAYIITQHRVMWIVWRDQNHSPTIKVSIPAIDIIKIWPHWEGFGPYDIGVLSWYGPSMHPGFSRHEKELADKFINTLQQTINDQISDKMGASDLNIESDLKMQKALTLLRTSEVKGLAGHLSGMPGTHNVEVGHDKFALTHPYVQRISELHTKTRWKFESAHPLLQENMLASVNHGIYRSVEKFPEFCCACANEADHVELIEAGLPKQETRHRTSVSPGEIDTFFHYDSERKEVLQVWTNRLFDAATESRVWYAIPFCQNHNLNSKSVKIQNVSGSQISGSQLTIELTNDKYGRLFGEMNGLQGKWIEAKPWELWK